MTDVERMVVALERIVVLLEGLDRRSFEPKAEPEFAYAPPPPHTGSSNWTCPIHHSVKTVPAGVSQRTGKAYTAFQACAEMGCNEKPPR